MRVIVIGNQKGGVGKSMLAANLAVCAAKDGKKVMIIDADTQASSMSWRAMRQNDDIGAVAINTTALAKDVRNFDGFDFVIIDAGGRDSACFRAAVMCARYGALIVPVLPGASDIWASQDTLDIVSEARAMGVDIPVYMGLNRVKSKAALVGQVRDLLAQLAEDKEVGILDTSIGDREDLPKAYAGGLGVIETAPNGKAGTEIKALYNDIINLIGGN